MLTEKKFSIAYVLHDHIIKDTYTTEWHQQRDQVGDRNLLLPAPPTIKRHLLMNDNSHGRVQGFI